MGKCSFMMPSRLHLFFILCMAIVVYIFRMASVKYHFMELSSKPGGPDIVLLEEPNWYLLCVDVQSNRSRPCLCYYDSRNIPVNFTLPMYASIKDLNLIHNLGGRCAMTVNAIGRLGNLMCEYAVVYALAKTNNRPAFMLKAMSNVLSNYFNLTMPILSETVEQLKDAWAYKELHFWMEDSYANLTDTFLQITGYPYSWTYFHHLRHEILREFTFSDEVIEKVRQKLLKLRSGRQTVTYVGVHARRSDYIHVFETADYRGVIADKDFFKNATNYFRSKYSDCIFVVASDDLKWCEENIDNSLKDVYLVGSGDIAKPIEDMALLANCNHSIITIGTFGFWTAYLAGGETVHFTNYSKPGVYYDKVTPPDKLYLPNWIPIAANRSSIL